MTLKFDEVKATQAAAFFLRLAGRPLGYMALIKLLYKADREALRRWGLPITTDRYVSMKYGPVTSNIYDRIKESANSNVAATIWSEHIQRTPADPYLVELRSDPGRAELSCAEIELMQEIFASDGAKDGFTLADECHRDFPEWKDPGDSSKPLEIADILSALGLSEEEVAHVEASIDGQRAAFELAV